jgi:hypothetical protein
MPDVASVLETSAARVHKWPITFVAVAPLTGDRVTQPFASDRRPNALPSGWFQLGYVTTDGHTIGKSVDSEDTNADQQLEAVRTDLTGSSMTYSATFMETDNPYVAGLYHGIDLALWPTDPDVAWQIPYGAQVYPYMQLLLVSQDRAGTDAIFKVEYFPNTQITSLADRTTSRADVDVYELTWSIYPDETLGAPGVHTIDGPGYAGRAAAGAGAAQVDPTFATDQSEAIADVAPDLPAGSGAGQPPAAVAITDVTAGQPSTLTPAGADVPADLAALKADAVVGDSAWSTATKPAWSTSGDYITLGDGSQAHWDGSNWVTGAVS